MTTSTKSHDFLDAPSQPGDLGMLGHYRVISELGRGGMGYVFCAEDVKLKRAVALKVMNQKIAATPHSRRRFLEEARSMAAVHHDNVVTIFEVGESSGTPFMAMEMLKGETLESRNKANEPLGYEKIIDYARQIARGLAAAHARGIVHRDIKPANIWIEEETERIKILDFGLALASSPVDHLSGRGAVIGTPGYLSPEQARSDALDDRSDLYSLGAVLYELCCGQLPIRAKSVAEQLISILAHRPVPINEINPHIPRPLCDVIHCLLRKEPRKRPQSAAALVKQLQRVEEESHANSEVAQTISKLQVGLNEVFNKQEPESLFDVVDGSIPDPLTAAPDPLAAAPAAAAIAPPARPHLKPSAARSSPPAWHAYWPLAAIGAVVLIALPILTYLFTSSGTSGPAAAIVDADRSAANRSTSQRDDSEAQPTIESSPPNRRQAVEDDPTAGGRGQRDRAPAGRDRGDRNQQNRGSAEVVNVQDDVPPVVARSDEESSPPTTVASPVSARPEMISQQQDDAAAASAPEAPEVDESQATPELIWTTITTKDGRGADTIVEKNGDQQQGLRPSVGVASRNRSETHHSYLRFDLAKIEGVKRHVKSAGIILTLVGGEPAIGSQVRVYGVSDVALWPETELEWNNSYSKRGLGTLPLLGEATITADNASQIHGRPVVRVTGPGFADFISSADDTVTMVVAGVGIGSQVLRFFSRESPVNAPPALLVQAPKTAPPVEPTEIRRRRN